MAYTPELEVASQGKTREESERNLRKAIQLFIETAKKRKTLSRILEESGFIKKKSKWHPPSITISPLEVKV